VKAENRPKSKPEGRTIRPIREWSGLAAVALRPAAQGASPAPAAARPDPRLDWWRCTERRLDAGTTRLYLHVWDRPADGVLVVPGLLNDVIRARPLATIDAPFELRVERKGDDVIVGLGLASGPGPAPDEVIALDIAGKPRVKAAAPAGATRPLK
jgi:hypothetical protein